jgi:hypothetical protein
VQLRSAHWEQRLGKHGTNVRPLGTKIRPTWNNVGPLGTKIRPTWNNVRPLGTKVRPTNEEGH